MWLERLGGTLGKGGLGHTRGIWTSLHSAITCGNNSAIITPTPGLMCFWHIWNCSSKRKPTETRGPASDCFHAENRAGSAIRSPLGIFGPFHFCPICSVSALWIQSLSNSNNLTIFSLCSLLPGLLPSWSNTGWICFHRAVVPSRTFLKSPSQD